MAQARRQPSVGSPVPAWDQHCPDVSGAAFDGWATLQTPPRLFTNARGEPMTRSGFEYIPHKHARTAATSCPSLSTKRVSPHVLRHTCALTVLQATKDLRKESLWLGDANMQTTEIYTSADPPEKLDTLESIVPPKPRRGRFKAADELTASLQAVSFMRSEKAST